MIKDILKNEVFEISNTKHLKMNTKNGILDNIDLSINKSLCLIEVLEDLSQLVSYKQAYPIEDQSAVTFDVNIVVMKGDVYNKLIKLLDGNK
jgi:hypothetical protein